jgi:asparagine synthase (glutamine-hydrolysing)
MSGFCGAVDFTGAPIEPGILLKMAAVSRGLGAHGAFSGRTRGGMLCHLSFNATPRSLTEQQIIRTADEAIWLVADVRLDNRPELISQLAAHDLLREDEPSDAAVLLAAYSLWGTTCPKYLLGDFAFVVWDDRKRRLFFARDPLGIKPLHYARIGSLVCFGSEAQQVLQHPMVPRRLDQQTIADYLGEAREDPERTFFLDVRRLPPAHSMVCTVDGERKERHWSIDPERKISYRDEREYGTHFLEIFQRAVGDRLVDSSGPVGIAMSGGLDSTSVAAAARRQIAADDPSATLFCCSFVFPTLRQCDERPYIETAAGALGLDVEFVDAEKFWLLSDETAYRPQLETPLLAWESLFREMTRHARARGARILLTGHGGDDLMAGSMLVYADRLRQGDLGVLVETFSYAATQGTSGWRSLYRYFGQPLLPASIDRTLRRVFGKSTKSSIPDWLDPEFVRSSGLEKRLSYQPARHARGAAWQELHDEFTHFCSWDQAVQWYSRNACPLGIEVRHPFLDRRLAEFVLAIPPGVRSKPGCYKPLLRRAMEGLLPEAIRNRQDKTALNAFLALSLRHKAREKVERLLKNPIGAEIGILDPVKLRSFYRMWQNDEHAKAQGLWQTVTLEIWLHEFMDQIDLTETSMPGSLTQPNQIAGAGSSRGNGHG